MIFGVSERRRKMKSYATCLAVIIGAHLASVTIFERGSTVEIFWLLLAALLIQGAANTFLHFTFCVSGKVASFALPLMWAFCMLPLYGFCVYIAETDSYSPGLVFAVHWFCVLVPALLISILTCVIFYIVKKFHK